MKSGNSNICVAFQLIVYYAATYALFLYLRMNYNSACSIVVKFQF